MLCSILSIQLLTAIRIPPSSSCLLSNACPLDCAVGQCGEGGGRLIGEGKLVRLLVLLACCSVCRSVFWRRVKCELRLLEVPSDARCARAPCSASCKRWKLRSMCCWRSRTACGMCCRCDDALCAPRPWRVCAYPTRAYSVRMWLIRGSVA